MKRENASNFKIPLPNSRSSQQRPPLSQDEVRQVDHADPQHPSQPSSSNAAERNRQTWTQRISSLVPRPFALNTTSSVPETTESSSNSKARASRIDNSGTSLTRKVSRSGKPSWRTRKHLASSILASIPAFSNPRVYTYDNDLYRSGEPLDPLLTAQYDEPQIIKAFADALTGEDLGLNAEEEEAEEINRQPLTEGQQEGAESDLDLEKEQRTAWKDEVPGADAMPSNSLLSGGDDPDPSKSTTKHAPPRHLGEDSIVRRGEHTNGNAPTTPMRARSKSINKKDLFLSSASDFAPIRERRQPTRSKGGRNVNKLRGSDTGTREGLVYKLIRFPLLFAIFFTIALEFLLYVIIRQAVNLVEYAIAWKGKKGELRKELRKANSWKEWRRWAVEMDEYVGYGRWKEKDASGLYDWILVRKVVKSLRQFRERDDAEKVLGVLNLCVRNNFAGVEGFRLYSETFFGTKNLIERYVDEVEESLDYIRKTDKIDLEAKRGFYRTVKKNFGTSALCLSGGASFGYYHFGVVRALLDAGLLPKYISGTSAGGLIAALVCTRHEHELKKLIVPELADRITACEESIVTWGPRAMRIGARFEGKSFAQKAQFFTMGSLTFMEAYKRTGKVLNISCIPVDRHSPVKLLNYVTSPDCVIWSALLASAAVPGILNPICLMAKTRSGQVVPWNWGHRFKDGSLRMDIPLQELQSLYNVNYPIVSQCNPHVHLFYFAPQGAPGRPVAHRKGKGWRGGFILSAAEHVLKLHLSMNFKVMRDLDLMPKILGQDWSSTFLQAFSGAVTIWPKTRAWDWVRLLQDPDRGELKRMLQVGKSVTFPKLHMIENRVRLERAVERGRKACRAAMRERTQGQGQNDAVMKRSATLDSQASVLTDREGGPASAITPGGASETPGALPTGHLTDTDGEDFFQLTRSSSSKERLAELKRLAMSGETAPAAKRDTVSRLAPKRSAEAQEAPASTPGLTDDEGLRLGYSDRETGPRVGKAGDRKAKRRAERRGLEMVIGANTDDGLEDDEDLDLDTDDAFINMSASRTRTSSHSNLLFGSSSNVRPGASPIHRRFERSRRWSSAGQGHRKGTSSPTYADRGTISPGGAVVWHKNHRGSPLLRDADEQQLEGDEIDEMDQSATSSSEGEDEEHEYDS